MAKKHSRNRRRTHRRKQRGAGYSFGVHSVAPEAPYAQEVIGGPPLIPDCLSATRPGLAGPIAGTGGLPGFAGGMRASLNEATIEAQVNTPANTMLKGGRYSFDVGAGPISPSTPFLGSYPEVVRIGCEGGLVNTSPPGALPNPTPLTQSGGVGGIDSAFYTAPTAGYGNKASDFVDSVGGPVLLQTPYDARIMNPACLKTGGSMRRKLRKTRKRKATKNHRKTKHNKNRR
jgi:hypothetical protein